MYAVSGLPVLASAAASPVFAMVKGAGDGKEARICRVSFATGDRLLLADDDDGEAGGRREVGIVD